ncbi:MAG: uroporphyrinogen decarboxylase family protein, partial [Clostridia bacterium]
VRIKPGIVSIPAEIGTLLTGREAWETLYLPRLQDQAERLPTAAIAKWQAEDATRTLPLALHCGSLYGNIRNMLGVEHLSYLALDDEDLYLEIIDTCAHLCYDVAVRMLQTGITFDYAHFWEDICFNHGPLVRPEVFARHVGPHYRRICDMLRAHGIDIVSVDCDGKIDRLLPIWLENGVNTMFPIEVGTWQASIAPWRAQYGDALRGVGGMDKRVFAQDRAAIDAELVRLTPLVDLGGYIPCPDHRIAPDAKFELVQYYCEGFRKLFG